LYQFLIMTKKDTKTSNGFETIGEVMMLPRQPGRILCTRFTEIVIRLYVFPTSYAMVCT
jgi:hypothetical protein